MNENEQINMLLNDIIAKSIESHFKKFVRENKMLCKKIVTIANYDSLTNTATVYFPDSPTIESCSYPNKTGVTLNSSETAWLLVEPFNVSQGWIIALYDSRMPESDGSISMSASDILTALKTVDGTGSGLDADLLDGNNSTAFAVSAKGVTNGDSHDHSGGDGAQIDHTTLSNKGTNTHSQIDSHIGSTVNPHSVTKAQVGLTNVTDDVQVKLAGGQILTGTLTAQNNTSYTTKQIHNIFEVDDTTEVGDYPTTGNGDIILFYTN
jgi:hypothetical protein